ncbi:hypothetical protein EG68_04507 [Paragonimus skrjabini miyazakii]|uniref:Uncharacterized protein n=1 Tax=Paragonimus skrjabini miyazakii TaxID=59628 RepID=A0A8S9Z2R1_9TREM|nr:hypothetical protein EG68_04507 [Paragonimus skrjabini miyazakii]
MSRWILFSPKVKTIPNIRSCSNSYNGILSVAAHFHRRTMGLTCQDSASMFNLQKAT